MIDDLYPQPTEASISRISEWSERSNMLQWLNFSARLEEGKLRYQLNFEEHHIGNEFIRALHGGVVSSFLQTSAMAEIYARARDSHELKVISVHCDFLRPARDMNMQGEAKILHRGRRVAFLEVTGWHNDPVKPVGKAAIAIRLL